MIQFRRGTTKSWRDAKVKLAAGQPGYDKDKHKIKIGDGESNWADLPYASGLSAEEIFDSEANAQERQKNDVEDRTIITYGTDAPSESTIGKIYLQQGSNTDYVIETGINSGWFYQIYASGLMKCSGTFVIETDIADNIEGTGLYCANGTIKKNYPKQFKNVPVETVSIQGINGLSWVANKGINTTISTGLYTIISPYSINNGKYQISIQVEGIKK